MSPDWRKRGLRMLAGLLATAAACACAGAQTHKVAKQQNVVRAIGVYEWTGDMAKPTASRLIPVSLYIDNELRDADVYLAQPVPFALQTDNVYELQKSGLPLGTLDLKFARHFVAPETATTTYNDGWFGYGKFVPPALEKKSTLKGHAVEMSLNGMDQDDSVPHFSAKSAKPGTGAAANPTGATASTSSTPADDPDRPTLHRSAGSSDQAGTQTASSGAGSIPPDDPNRPTLHRPASTSDQSDSSGSQTASGASGSKPADDPDRPTLRRRTPEQAKAAQAEAGNLVDNTLNNDPNRPTLHRGKPAGEAPDTDIPKLSGLPGDLDLHQMVAVSDAANRPEHDFSRTWEGDDERQAILSKMEAAAREQLTAYEAANGVAPKAASTARTTSRARKPAAPPAPPPEPLLEEKLTGYTLSYGGADTFVYQAHTDGLGPTLRFVTLVAQVNMQGEPEIALKSVTDAEHLDRTPRMRLVDVVDAEASNRASLLFEMRAQNSRQFALYRVIGGQATQTFITGSTK